MAIVKDLVRVHYIHVNKVINLDIHSILVWPYIYLFSQDPFSMNLLQLPQIFHNIHKPSVTFTYLSEFVLSFPYFESIILLEDKMFSLFPSFTKQKPCPLYLSLSKKHYFSFHSTKMYLHAVYLGLPKTSYFLFIVILFYPYYFLWENP